MVHRDSWVLIGGCVLSGALLLAFSGAGCRAETRGSTSDGDGGNDNTTSSSSVSGSGSTSGSGGGGVGGGDGGSPTGGGGSGTGGGAPACDGQEVTIFDVNNDPTATPVGPDVKVKLKGVVAMSQKFLVAKSNSSGSCLWGVFVSAPGLGKSTVPYSGTMVLSYGNKATVDPQSGNSFCPKLGIDPIGDAIPDDVKPGDVLNVTGKTDYFLLNACANEPNGATVAQRQVSNSCLVEKTGMTELPPPPHLLTAQEVIDLASPDNKAFHDMWGGVKVRVEGPVATVEQMVMGMPSVLNGFGEFFLEGSNLSVGDKLYYRGYLKATDACHDAPKLPLGYMVDSVEGFSYLNYCTWSLQPNNKCTDLMPASDDCAMGGPGGTPLMCK